MSSAEAVALRLLEAMKAPGGAVNAIVLSDAKGVYIRLLIDPEHREVWDHVPKRFQGYRVVAEHRAKTVAYAGTASLLIHAPYHLGA